MGNQVITIPLLRVMQRLSLHYCIIVLYHYVIITQGSIRTHYYIIRVFDVP